MRNIAKLLFVLVFLSYQAIVFFTSDGLSGFLFSVGIGVFSFFLVFGVLWKPKNASRDTKRVAKETNRKQTTDESISGNDEYISEMYRNKQFNSDLFSQSGRSLHVDNDERDKDTSSKKQSSEDSFSWWGDNGGSSSDSSGGDSGGGGD